MIREKELVRKEISRLKRSLSDGTAACLSQKIGGRLIRTDAFQKAGCIAFYHSVKGEVETVSLIEEWCRKKKIVLPAVSGKDLRFYSYTGKESLTAGVFGIREPAPSEEITAEQIDLFIVPGIAFDRKGNRMGRGGGYYDRFLSGTEKPVIGLCFGFQLLEQIPTEVHDKKMTLILTEDITVSSHHQSHPTRHDGSV
ncbi:MAG: 5-formyltetrahydrofolate cyclo-ligase [Tannerella sp.]|jgi:5-formyltetrahydrofolate cyclo-ligase|nr:5-formyltetrahydrofolate cyclo-ligase [Tannerella sp.]